MEAERTSGLQRLETCFCERLGVQDSGRAVFRWAGDGFPFLRLHVLRANDGLHYLWLDEANPKIVRKELAGIEELEELIKRQLIEPGGEELLVYWDEEPFPVVQCRAIILAGDRLDTVWEE